MSRLIFSELGTTPSDTDTGAGQVYFKGDVLCFKRSDNQETNLIELSGGKVTFGTDGYGTLEQESTTVRFKSSVAGEVHLMTHDGGEDIHLNSAGYIQFEAAGVEAMRIDSSQNVGIGTTTPQGLLHIKHATNSTQLSANHIFGISTGGISISAVPIAKAWINFNGTSSVAIGNSYNVASLTDNGAGDYTVNFATDITSAAYCAVGSSGAGATPAHNKNLNVHTQAVGSVKVTTSTTDNVLTDCGTVNVAVFAL